MLLFSQFQHRIFKKDGSCGREETGRLDNDVTGLIRRCMWRSTANQSGSYRTVTENYPFSAAYINLESKLLLQAFLIELCGVHSSDGHRGAMIRYCWHAAPLPICQSCCPDACWRRFFSFSSPFFPLQAPDLLLYVLKLIYQRKSHAIRDGFGL